MNNNIQSVSKIYQLNNYDFIGVDQTNSNEDKTCLCFCKRNADGTILVKDFKYIEKQEDIDNYINKNISKFNEIFTIDEE